MSEEGQEASEVRDLEEPLKALSFSNRLELLGMLRVPRTVDEIRLTSSQAEDEPGGRERPLSREAVRHHLERLDETGLVRSELTHDPDGRTRKRYVLDESRLYELSERLRRLCHKGEGSGVDPRSTQDTSAIPEGWDDPPRLVLVHGAPEQRSFALRSKGLDAPRGWILGRGDEADVTLPYDPFISAQNTEILPTEGGFQVVNLRTARNGTILNDRPLEPGEETDLEHGDVLGLGSSVLVFHAR